jgi:hypothetical protein
MSAVNDALSSIGAPEIEMPATSQKVWGAINSARVDGTTAGAIT